MHYLYDFLVQSRILSALDWLSKNLAFSFAVGMFFGVFLIYAAHWAQLVSRIKQFADENQVVVKYDYIKQHICNVNQQRPLKYHFFSPFRSEHSLTEHLREMYDTKLRKKV